LSITWLSPYQFFLALLPDHPPEFLSAFTRPRVWFFILSIFLFGLFSALSFFPLYTFSLLAASFQYYFSFRS